MKPGSREARRKKLSFIGEKGEKAILNCLKAPAPATENRVKRQTG